MALIKSTTLPQNGSVGEYWMIKDIVVQKVLETAVINYGMIINKAFRDANYESMRPMDREALFLTNKSQTISGEDYTTMLSEMAAGATVGAYPYAYSLLKEKDENLSDAVNG